MSAHRKRTQRGNVNNASARTEPPKRLREKPTHQPQPNQRFAKFQKNGSGWRLKSIERLEISLTKFEPLRGSGYSALPPFIAKKKAVINMRNKDDQCFKWAVTRDLHPADDHAHIVTELLREQSNQYNWERIEFPTKVKDIEIWEANNDIKVNVFGFDEDEKKIYTIRIGGSTMYSQEAEHISDDEPVVECTSDNVCPPTVKCPPDDDECPPRKRLLSRPAVKCSSDDECPPDDEPPIIPRKRLLSRPVTETKGCEASEICELNEATQDTINLLLHDDNHFCPIRDLSRLVSSQLSKNKSAKHICLQYLNAFGSKWTLRKHEELCSKQKTQCHMYPKPGSTVSFKNYERLHEIPFVVYADFECFVEPISPP